MGKSNMQVMRDKFVNGAITTHQDTPHPISKNLANRVFKLVAKFVGYGFCRSHAADFARTVYQSAYLKAHYPAQYMAVVLQHQPGFYPMQTLLEKARRLGMPVLPPCLHRSQIKYSLKTDLHNTLSIRVPFSQINGVSDDTASQIVLERAFAPFASLDNALERLRLPINDWKTWRVRVR